MTEVRFWVVGEGVRFVLSLKLSFHVRDNLPRKWGGFF
jgi:hypothetical protein